MCYQYEYIKMSSSHFKYIVITVVILDWMGSVGRNYSRIFSYSDLRYRDLCYRNGQTAQLRYRSEQII